jgi:preprotein translocase subunit YajC
MFVTEAFAQAAPGAPGAGDMIGFIVPMIAIMGVFYFFMIRPQQQKAKEHQKMLSQVTRGDTIVTSGGLIGKVVRVVDDNELLVEVGENVRVRVLRQGVADLRVKGEPMKPEPKAEAPAKKK